MTRLMFACELGVIPVCDEEQNIIFLPYGEPKVIIKGHG